MTLLDAREGEDHIIRRVDTGDEETDAFLLTLGCYPGGSVTVVSHGRGGCVVCLKDSRYTFDNQLAATIEL